MDKNLINKNISEFMHWLRGGSVLISEYCYDEHKYSNWVEVPSDSSWNWDYIHSHKPKFVINDKYVNFRIAIIEGDVIEILDTDGKWKYTGHNSSDAFIYPVEDYRIKKRVSKYSKCIKGDEQWKI